MYMDVLQGELIELQAKEAALSAEWEAINSEPNVNVSRFNEVSAQLNAVRDEIKVNQSEIDRQTVNQFDEIQFGDNTFALFELCGKNEARYQILKGWLQGFVGDLVRNHEEVITSYNSEIDQLQVDLKGKQEELSEMENIRRRNHDLDIECVDISAKRDAAVIALEESEEEVRRLNADNESLRRQLAATSKPVNTNIDANLEEMAQQLKAERPVIYNLRWENDITRKYRIANLLETGEEVKFVYYAEKGYRVATDAEVERFRSEQEAKRLEAEAAAVVEENHADSPLVEYPTPPTIPSEETDTQLQGGAAGGTMVPEELEARLAEVERQVRQLNMQVFNTLEFVS